MFSTKKQVALDVLKAKCSKVEFQEEADVTLSLLRHATQAQKLPFSISAPEVNVLKQVAIVQTSDMYLELVNPVILEGNDRIISFHEPCTSFRHTSLNCLRYRKIVLQNGLKGDKLLTLEGLNAVLIQHAVDHLNGIVFYDRAIKLALVRDGGEIKPKDFCPCRSRKRFRECCMNT